MLVRGALAALSMTHVEALLVQSDSDCPSAEVVQAEVRELTTLEQRRGVLPGSKAVISDRGESISIAITRDGKTSVRVYRDAARDCERRGHFVSVLVVVSLMPPDLGDAPDAGGALPTEQQPPNGGKPATPEPATGVERPPGRTQEPDATTEPTPREPSVDHRRRYIRIEPYALAVGCASRWAPAICASRSAAATCRRPSCSTPAALRDERTCSDSTWPSESGSRWVTRRWTPASTRGCC